ncbi:hypothetical protein MRX96_032367 [Rhipicephalus microplus]
MDMPPDHTMLLVEQVRVLQVMLRSAPTPDFWATWKAALLAAPALSEGHLVLLTGGDLFLDVREGVPADLGGPGHSGSPWRPPDAGRWLVKVYRSFPCLAHHLPPAACLARFSLPADNVIDPGHRRDLIAVVACRPADLVLRGPGTRSRCSPDPPTWIAPTLVREGSSSQAAPRSCSSGSAAPPPPQRPRPGTPDSPAAGPSSPASTALPSYNGAIWTCRVQPVRRHVEFEHGGRVNDRIYVCSVCDSPLTSRPSNHRCLATATLAASTETPRRRSSVCNATFTSVRGLANHLRCHVDQAGPSSAARARAPARRVRHVNSSTTTSSSSLSSPPPAASRASRHLRGLAPTDATPSVRPSSSPAAGLGASSPASTGEPPAFVYLSTRNSSTSVGSASVHGSPAPSPAASPVSSEQPKHDAGVTFSWPPHIGVPTPAGVLVDSPIPGSPLSPDSASQQRPPFVRQTSLGSIRRRAFVVVAWRGSRFALLVGGLTQWRCCRVSSER